MRLLQILCLAILTFTCLGYDWETPPKIPNFDFNKVFEALLESSSEEELESLINLKKIFENITRHGLLEYEKLLEKDRPLSRDDDTKRNVSQLITSKNYSCQNHVAKTSDGYLLSIQRVGPQNSTTGWFDKTKPVVLLQHGFLDSSSTWVINDASNSLGFMLADAGFDVWMSNSRGNTYSHSNVDIKDWRRKFWDFSWDEMAKHDLPAVVDYILDQTNASYIYYVGHSQGTLIGFTGFSANKTLGSKIKKFFALAPIATAGHIKGPIRLAVPFHDIAYDFLNVIGYEEVLPSSFGEELLARTVCGIVPIVCELITFSIAGIDFLGFDKKRSDVYYTHFPAGTSLRDVNHWAQLIQSGETQMYDYGWFDNKRHYNSHQAPIYNITDLEVPVALFSGGRDWLADPKDVDVLRETINHTIVYDKTLDRYDHLDFVWGKYAHFEIYEEIILQIKEGELGEEDTKEES